MGAKGGYFGVGASNARARALGGGHLECRILTAAAEDLFHHNGDGVVDVATNFEDSQIQK